LASCCCCECGEVISDDTRALQCERCVTETWKCTGCLELSDELYDELVTSNKNCLHWFCSKCEDYVLDNLSVAGEKIVDTLEKLSAKTNGIEQHLIENSERIEKQLMNRIHAVEQLLEKKTDVQWKLVENRLKKLEERPTVIEETQERIELKVDQLKRNMDEPMVQVVQGALEGVLQQDKEEEMEIERRKKNVIVHGVSEPQAADADQRVEEDLTVLAAMFHEVGVDELKVESVARLGKRNEDAEHPRPMKVVLDCEEGKVKLLRNAKKLEDKTGRRLDEGVYPSGSNTKAKGSKKTTVVELKQGKANGEKDLIIFNGKVVRKKVHQSAGTIRSVSILMPEVLLINLTKLKHGYTS